jgi:hypothetical protein
MDAFFPNLQGDKPVNAPQSAQLFTDLSMEESAIVQGGRCRRSWRAYRPAYYSYRPTTYSYYPTYSYSYGYGGYGGYSSINQTVNVTVRYDD